MTDFIEALSAELAALEAELASDPRYRKIAGLRSLLAEYKRIVPPTRAGMLLHKLSVRAPQTNSKKSRVHDGIVSFLAAHPGAHRSELLSDLIGKGLMGDEKDPMASLAAYLSDFRSELQNNGQGHWSLKELAPNAEAPGPIESLTQGDQTGAV